MPATRKKITSIPTKTGTGYQLKTLKKITLYFFQCHVCVVLCEVTNEAKAKIHQTQNHDTFQRVIG